MDAITLSVSDSTVMGAFVAEPKEPARAGVMVFQEAFGVTDYIRRVTRRFADRGYLAIAPELFHRTAPVGFEAAYDDYQSASPHMEAMTDEGVLADARAAQDWLVSQGIGQAAVAAVGFCMGGRASFLVNSELPLCAAVSFYGGGIAQSLLERAATLRAPQLLLWGGKDGHILPEHVRAVSDALQAAGKPFVEAVFSEAGHAFARDVGASFHEESTNEAWALADAFLSAHSS